MRNLILLVISFLIFSLTAFPQWTQIGGTLSGLGQSPRICVVDSNVVWIAGGFSTSPSVYRTADGGVNWVSIPATGLPYFLTAIAAKDSLTAFVADAGGPTINGGNAKLYKTTDAGLNWTVIDSTGGTAGFYNDIQFSKSNPQFGIAMSDPANGPGGPYIVNKTTDGGVTWVKTNPPGVPNSYGILYDAYAIDSQFYGFASWNNPAGKVYSYTTNDGGSNWFLGDSGIQVLSWGDIVFNDDKQHGVMIGAEWPNIKLTSNGGNNWITINTGTDVYGFSNASWVSNSDIVFICTNLSNTNPGIIRSNDNGLTWQKQETPALAKKEIDNVRHGSVIYGYVITTDGAVLKSVQSIYTDTLHVPGDYSSIQAAIDAAVSGNVVLVAEDTYYENINFKGRAITVASHFLIDGDSTHIENTIIDGSQPSHPDSGSVVYFISGEDKNSVIYGFTITGGTGTYTFFYNDKSGGGIFLNQTGATICNNIIENNSIDYTSYVYGGGIFIHDTTMRSSIIKDNVVINNTCNSSTNATAGGGIFFLVSGIIEILNNKIIDNSVSGPYTYGGGIDCNGRPTVDIFINSNYIKGNESTANNYGGGGLDIWNCSPIVKNNLITENYAAFGGGGILVIQETSTSSKSGKNNIKRLSSLFDGLNSSQYSSKVTLTESLLENNTIVNNTALIGGGVRSVGFNPEIINCIVWGNDAQNGSQIYGTADVQYSDVEGGWPGTGNIDEDPNFDDSSYFVLNYHSSCVDKGHPDAQYYDVEDPQHLGYALLPARGTVINDMGHFGGPGSLWSTWDIPVSVRNDANENGVPSEFILLQNYPNPFNPTTTIKYGINESSFVELRIYDILGRELRQIVNEEQDAGCYEAAFNADRLASGVYFYRLQAGSFIQTKKMLLLK